MIRCVIYARYSNAKLQSDKSIDDQISECRAHAEQMGYTVTNIYTDAGISGSSMINRSGFRDLLSDAEKGLFSVVVSEALDRISRSMKDTASIYERLTYYNIKVMTSTEGEITDMHVGFKGTMNAMFLTRLAESVKRGQKGMIMAGKVASGLAYGYDVVREFDDQGKSVSGKRSINEYQSSVIIRIFQEYANGRSTRKIAHGLNADNIPSPTGGAWRASTIAGNKSRGSGILWNQAYIGFIVWGRVSMVKHPDTGKRLSRPNPPEEWLVRENQSLRIIDDKTWDAVQAVKANYCNLSKKGKKRPKRLLSGLIKCGVCDGNITVVKGGHYGCNTHREAGNSVCTNNRFIKIEKLDKLVLAGIKDKLLDPERIKEFSQEYQKQIKVIKREKTRQIGPLKKELAAVNLKISNLMKLAENGNAPEAVISRLNDLELTQADLSVRMNESSEADDVIDFHPGLPKIYKNKIKELESALTQTDLIQQEAALILRSIISSVKITPRKERGEHDIELHGSTVEILRFASPAGQSKASRERSKRMVAGGRLELPTSAL